MSKPVVTVYTDGACSGNPGPGGWGVLLEWNGKRKEISGSDPHTTNNRMEMMAVIQALKNLKKPCEVHIYSDSALIVNAFHQNWLQNWQKNNWKKADKKPVENQDLWQDMLAAIRPHNVQFHKVKGHANDERNNLVDKLAVEASKRNS